jgi:hypothetical protein
VGRTNAALGLLNWRDLLRFYGDAQKYFQPIHLTVAKYDFEFPGTISRDTVRAKLITFFKTKATDYHGTPEQDATEISQQFRGEDFPEFMQRMAVLLMSAPIALFALGALLFWIVAGFVKPKPQR